MSLYKNFAWTAVLALSLVPLLARAEEDSVQQAYFPACSDASLKDDAFCLTEIKNKEGKVSIELRQKSMISAYDDEGVYRETGELKDSKANRKDIYSAFSQNGNVDIFRGLKSCKDKSVPPGMVCVSDYDWARDENGKKLKKQAKVPSKIGMVSDRDENGDNKFHHLSKVDLMKYLTTPAKDGGAGIRFTTNEKDTLPKIKLLDQKTLVNEDELLPPPVEEEKKVAQQVTAPKDFDCQSSAIQNLNFPHQPERDAEVRRFLNIQAKLTHARVHYAFLNQISRNNKKFDYSKIMQRLEDEIVGLVRAKNGLAFKRVNDAYEKAPLTNRTQKLLKDNKFSNLLQNQADLGNKKPQVALGVSDLKYLTWASEGSADAPTLQFAEKVNSYIAKNDGTKNATIDALKTKLDSQVSTINAEIMSAKIGCQETAKCDALSDNINVGGGNGSITKIAQSFDKLTLNANDKAYSLRNKDGTAQIKNYRSPSERLKADVAKTDIKKTGDNTDGGGTVDLTEKAERPRTNNRSVAATNKGKVLKVGDVEYKDLTSKVQLADVGTTIQFGSRGCSVVVNKRTASDASMSFAVTVKYADGQTKSLNFGTWPGETSEFGQFYTACNPPKADKYTYHFSKLTGKQSGRFPVENSRFRALDESTLIDQHSGSQQFWADEITGNILVKVKEIAQFEAGKMTYTPGKDFWFRRCKVEFNFKGDGYQANNPSMRFVKIQRFDKAFDDKSNHKLIAEGPLDFGTYVLNTEGYDKELNRKGWYQGDIQRLSNYIEQVCR